MAAHPIRCARFANDHRVHLAALTVALVVGLAGAAAPVAADPALSCAAAGAPQGRLSQSCLGDLILSRGDLDLAGHTVLGSILCEHDPCTVTSDPPEGRILGDGTPGSVGVAAPGHLELHDVIVSGFMIGVDAASAELSGALVTRNAAYGVRVVGDLDVSESVVADNGQDGIHSITGVVSVAASEVSDNGGSGVHSLTGVTVSDSTLSGNGVDGVENFAKRALVLRSVVTGNGRHGVRTDDSDCDPTGSLELAHSTVSGNARGEHCGDGIECADLVACDAPRLRTADAACQTSALVLADPEQPTWGVCADD